MSKPCSFFLHGGKPGLRGAGALNARSDDCAIAAVAGARNETCAIMTRWPQARFTTVEAISAVLVFSHYRFCNVQVALYKGDHQKPGEKQPQARGVRSKRLVTRVLRLRRVPADEDYA